MMGLWELLLGKFPNSTLKISEGEQPEFEAEAKKYRGRRGNQISQT